MKAAALILGLLAVLFGYLLFQKNSALSTAEERLSTNELAHTNFVKQLQTELLLTNMVAGGIRSNLQHALDIRTAHLNVFSNRLVQANLLLQTAQEDSRSAQAAWQGLSWSNAALVARLEEQARQLAGMTRLQDQLTSARLQLTAAGNEHELVAQDLQSLQLEYTSLLRRLDDPTFLRAQMERTADAIALRKQAATRSISSSDRRLPLELMPDGSVRPMVPPKP